MTRAFRTAAFMLSIAVALCGGATIAPAQQSAAQSSGAAAASKPAPTETQERLNGAVDALANQLKDIEAQIDVQRPSEQLLTKLGNEVAPLVTKADAMVERLTPRAAAMKARLDQIGPKPEKGPPESPDVTKEREAAQQAFDVNDGLLKRARLLQVQAQQDAHYIGRRQRELFTRNLFQRSTSLLSPPLWFTIVRETPDHIADTLSVFRNWLGAFNANLSGGKLITFWSLVTLVVALYWPLTQLAKRLLAREAKVATPSTWQKMLVACWTSLSTAGLAIAVMYGVVYVFSFFTAPDPRMMPLFLALQTGVIRVAVAAGLARGVLAPNRPKWRPVPLEDATADQLVRIVMAIAVIIAVSRVVESLNDVIGAALEFSIAVRGVGALLVAAALGVALFDLRSTEDASDPRGGAELFGLARGFIWALIVVVIAAVLIGYIPFASFLVDQVTLVSAVGAVLYLVVKLSDEACAHGLKVNSPVGRALINTVGLRRETLGQLSVLLAGAARLSLFTIALIIVAAPWGMQSTDISGNLSAIFFGFKVGDVTISIAGIVVALVSFLLVLAATRGVQNWLEDRYLPQTRLDSGLRNSIKTSLGYTGFVLALSLAAANLGVDFQKLAIVAGALSVGIGFGLQSIVNNFVSGLILLWERAVRVGDWVVVGADQGYVRKINVRSTEIETFDRAAVIVPNSNLVSGVVKNLMRSDRVGRLSIDVSVNAASDPEKVREVLLEIARDNDDVLSLPSPQVRFTDLTSSTMAFSLFCFVGDVENMARTKSDLYFEICRQFRQNHFFDGPAPDPTRISLLGLDQIEALLRDRLSRAGDVESTRTRKAS